MMGASLAVAVAEEISEESPTNIIDDDSCIKNLRRPVQVDFKLEKFMNQCFILQKEKKSLESQIRIELDNWRARAKKGEPTTESRHRLSLYLKKFKAAHETQDILIEREKVRLCSYGKEADSRRVFELKDKLRFFSVLNKQHETLLEMVRQDLQDCRSICRKSKDDDSNVRYRITPRS